MVCLLGFGAFVLFVVSLFVFVVVFCYVFLIAKITDVRHIIAFHPVSYIHAVL